MSSNAIVHTWNKLSLDIKHDMRQAGMGLDIWDIEINSSKRYGERGGTMRRRVLFDYTRTKI